jgi:hypothetical protein
MTTATRTDWKIAAMPEARARLPYVRRFDRAEHERVTRGIVPAAMEDKWFIFHEASWLWFHRSWTGVAIYGVRLELDDDGSSVAEAWANRDPAQYRETDEGVDVPRLSFLVERILLGRNVPFPIPPGQDPATVPILIHRAVGYARSNDEE